MRRAIKVHGINGIQEKVYYYDIMIIKNHICAFVSSTPLSSLSWRLVVRIYYGTSPLPPSRCHSLFSTLTSSSVYALSPSLTLPSVLTFTTTLCPPHHLQPHPLFHPFPYRPFLPHSPHQSHIYVTHLDINKIVRTHTNLVPH